MHFHLQAVVTFAIIAFTTLSHAFNVTILADTNRDGVIEAATDTEGKDTWSASRGALFLPNIGDTDQRCSKQVRALRESYDFAEDEDSSELIAINALLDRCNDASDNTQRNPKYLAPLRVLPVTELSGTASGSIRVTSCAAAGKVRIFQKRGNTWTFISANHTFSADDLTAGLDLGIDARDVRRNSGWDGKAIVRLTVTDGDEAATDSVALRVAPVLTHHHAQPATRAFTVAAMYNNSQVAFVADFVKNVAEAGLTEPVFLFGGEDKWAQDFFEPGYASIPGPDGPIVLRIMIRSAQSYRVAGWEVFDRLRSDTVGAIQYLADGASTDSLGNLETIPPYTLNGTAYPAGRVIMGQWDGVNPFMFDLLKAQEVQSPIALDTSWLTVGHVDEFLQFLPADTPRGWVLMADDPRSALQLLRDAATDGFGSEPAVSRPLLPGEDSSVSCLPKHSIDDVLRLDDFTAINEKAAGRIERNIEILKAETGLADDEIFRVPSLFYYFNRPAFQCGNSSAPDPGNDQSVNLTARAATRQSGGPSAKAASILEAGTPSGSRGIARRQTSFGDQVVALYPGTINNVVLSDSLVLAPNPWGPFINGTDILAAAVSVEYAKVKFDVKFQDDWFSHHALSGEIHCGSNVWRETGGAWW
ncbi:hypothetical protein ACHAQA_009039 [Verticillium albo-atrum]